MGLMDNTFVFFSCDNGYHLGQHRLPPGKREAYQHDINVPLLVSGPGVGKGVTIPQLVGNYDLALTWAALGHAVIPPPPNNYCGVPDGKSLLPLLAASAVIDGHDAAMAAAAPRTYTLQEGYESCEAGHGEGKACSHTAHASGTSGTSGSSGSSGWMPLQNSSRSFKQGVGGLKARDYSGLRFKTATTATATSRSSGEGDGDGGLLSDSLYVEYVDGGKMYFDCAKDPWQTNNTYKTLTATQAAQLAAMLAAVKDCKGNECP